LQGYGQVYAEGAEESEHPVAVILYSPQHREMRRGGKKEKGKESGIGGGGREKGPGNRQINNKFAEKAGRVTKINL
jgi:hypothetical protein